MTEGHIQPDAKEWPSLSLAGLGWTSVQADIVTNEHTQDHSLSIRPAGMEQPTPIIFSSLYF